MNVRNCVGWLKRAPRHIFLERFLDVADRGGGFRFNQRTSPPPQTAVWLGCIRIDTTLHDAAIATIPGGGLRSVAWASAITLGSTSVMALKALCPLSHGPCPQFPVKRMEPPSAVECVNAKMNIDAAMPRLETVTYDVQLFISSWELAALQTGTLLT